MRVLLIAGWSAALIGALGAFLAESHATGASFSELAKTSTGRTYVMLGAALVALAVVGAGVIRRASRGWWWAVGALAVVAMFIQALGSHADNPSRWRWFNLGVELTHLVAVGVWIGGLVWLFAAIRTGRDADAPERRAGVVRFSTMAAVALAFVAASGLGRALDELNGLHSLFSTSFGQTLIVKTGLFAVLLGFGAYNHYRIVPKIRSGSGTNALRRSVRVELVVATATIFAGVLLEPASARVLRADADEPGAAHRRHGVGLRHHGASAPAGVARHDRIEYLRRAGDRLRHGRRGARAIAGADLHAAGRPGPERLHAQPHAGRHALAGDGLEPVGDGDVERRRGGAGDDRRGERADEGHAEAAAGAHHLDPGPAGPVHDLHDHAGGRVRRADLRGPAEGGPAAVHFTFFQSSGKEQPIRSASATRTGPSGTTSPMTLQRFDPGHFAANTRLTAGRWTFTIQAVTTKGIPLTAYFSETLG